MTQVQCRYQCIWSIDAGYSGMGMDACISSIYTSTLHPDKYKNNNDKLLFFFLWYINNLFWLRPQLRKTQPNGLQDRYRHLSHWFACVFSLQPSQPIHIPAIREGRWRTLKHHAVSYLLDKSAAQTIITLTPHNPPRKLAWHAWIYHSSKNFLKNWC